MKKLFIVLFSLFSFSALAQDIYSIKENDISGKAADFSQYKGKVLLIVNVASQCGYTSQLEGLETLYKKYKDKNVVVLGVPTNDFGGQTPEDDASFKEFCSKNYNVSFPLLTKKTILGESKRPLYKFLTEQSPKNFQGNVKWNFEKFLIGKDGKIVERFSSSVSPSDEKLVKKIDSLL